MSEWTAILAAGGLLITWTTTCVLGTWWLSRQFELTRQTTQTAIVAAKAEVQGEVRQLDVKFEAHEKLDAERFEEVKLGIMRIELREQSRGEIFGPSKI